MAFYQQSQSVEAALLKSGRLPETRRKLSETAGYSLQKHSSDASLASDIARSAKIL
jgi:hypothetical protein